MRAEHCQQRPGAEAHLVPSRRAFHVSIALRTPLEGERACSEGQARPSDADVRRLTMEHRITASGPVSTERGDRLLSLITVFLCTFLIFAELFLDM